MDTGLVQGAFRSYQSMTNFEKSFLSIIVGLTVSVLFALGSLGIFLGALFLSPSASLGLIIASLAILPLLCIPCRCMSRSLPVGILYLDIP